MQRRAGSTPPPLSLAAFFCALALALDLDFAASIRFEIDPLSVTRIDAFVGDEQPDGLQLLLQEGLELVGCGRHCYDAEPLDTRALRTDSQPKGRFRGTAKEFA